VGTTDALSAVLDVDVALAFARVERTLLSVAFDVDVDLDSELARTPPVCGAGAPARCP
jgi:hypothetical protein